MRQGAGEAGQGTGAGNRRRGEGGQSGEGWQYKCCFGCRHEALPQASSEVCCHCCVVLSPAHRSHHTWYATTIPLSLPFLHLASANHTWSIS